MQTYSPVSTNAGNNAKAKLESTRFRQDKNAINQQITEEEDDPRVGGQWRIATLSRRGKRSPAAGRSQV
jgi:hypothetical protein